MIGLKQSQENQYVPYIALTKTATTVHYWRTQMSACRNNIFLSLSTVSFSTKHSLPTTVLPQLDIYPFLYDAWTCLRKVQLEADRVQRNFLETEVAAAVQSKEADTATKIRRTACDYLLQLLYRKIRSISRDPRSGSLAHIKVSKHDWYYHMSSGNLFHYLKADILKQVIKMTFGEFMVLAVVFIDKKAWFCYSWIAHEFPFQVKLICQFSRGLIKYFKSDFTNIRLSRRLL